MARISGIDLNDNWRVDFALTKIKGIGWALSRSVLSDLKFDASKRVKDLTAAEISSLSAKITEFTVEGDLVRKIKQNIARLQAIGSYRGNRHSRGLPVRGQRTKTNGRTKRGKRKTVGAFKKEALAKTKTNK
ncbi:30S ribosomal protein S13 [Candidatus Microgenomates bacterium]|nr:30S ribosomal protein S13 [Candidatus Microgenomates bacterium]